MTDFIAKILIAVFGEHAGIATFLISMFPLVELKGSITLGMSKDFWGPDVLSGWQAFGLSFLGSCLIVPIVALVFIPIIRWLKKTKLFRKIGLFIEEKVKKHSNEINKKIEEDSQNSKKTNSRKTLIKWLSVFGFVAIPLPLTGFWTGTCVAVAIGLNYWQTITSVLLGNAIAGVIILCVCMVFPSFTTILFYVMMAIVLLIIIFLVVKFCCSGKKHKNELAKEKEDNNLNVDE